MTLRKNKLEFAGHAAHDASMRMTQAQTRVISVSIADSIKLSDGKEKTTWVKAIFFENPNKPYTKYICDEAMRIKKGMNVLVEGRIGLNIWNTKQGEMRADIEVNCNSVAIIDKAPKSEDSPPFIKNAIEPHLGSIAGIDDQPPMPWLDSEEMPF